MSNPLTPGSIVPLSGISRYQDAVKLVEVGQAVICTHTMTNPYDPYCVEVETLAGDQLGYIPTANGLNQRLVGTHQGGIWGGVVVEKLDEHETVGLRVQINKLLRYVEGEKWGAQHSGHREDITTDNKENVQNTQLVYTISGRLLGTWLETTTSKTYFLTPNGKKNSYPKDIVTIKSVDDVETI